jgi:hypothetical protein
MAAIGLRIGVAAYPDLHPGSECGLCSTIPEFHALIGPEATAALSCTIDANVDAAFAADLLSAKVPAPALVSATSANFLCVFFQRVVFYFLRKIN